MFPDLKKKKREKSVTQNFGLGNFHLYFNVNKSCGLDRERHIHFQSRTTVVHAYFGQTIYIPLCRPRPFRCFLDQNRLSYLAIKVQIPQS